MPMKLSIGLSKKIGLPDYGSLGAICNLELELDQALIIHDDLEGFHDRVGRTFIACRQAMDDELAHHRTARAGGKSAEVAQSSSSAARDTNGHHNGNENGRGGNHGGDNRNGNDRTNGNGANQNGGNHRATQKQLDYAQHLAGQINGLSLRRFESLAQKMFSKPLADLPSLEASGLLDVLKDVKAGTIDLAAALSGAANNDSTGHRFDKPTYIGALDARIGISAGCSP